MSYGHLSKNISKKESKMIIHKAKVELAFTGLVLAGIAKDLNALAFIG